MSADVTRSSPTTTARALFAGLPARYDLLAAVLSLGQDRRWRRAMIDRIELDNPSTVLDVATGPAGVALDLADRTDALIVGVDLSPEMLARGAGNVAAAGRNDRISLVLAQGERLPFGDATFEALTFTYLLRYVADPAETIAELARVIRPGGVMASLEFAVPDNRFWRWWWTAYTRFVLPAAGAALGGRAWFDVGRFLGPSITGYYERFPLSEHTAAWEAAGLCDVGCRPMSLGGGLVMWGRKTTDSPTAVSTGR